MDALLFLWINVHWSNANLDGLAPLFTYTAGMTAGFLFLLIVLALSRSGWSFLWAGLAYGLNAGVFKLMKYTVLRDRPFEVLNEAILRLEPELSGATDPSFPSGHAAVAFMIAAFFAARYPRLTPVFLLWAIGVSLSRVYLGLHYPSDVVVGAAVGLSAALLVLGLAEKTGKLDAWVIRD